MYEDFIVGEGVTSGIFYTWCKLGFIYPNVFLCVPVYWGVFFVRVREQRRKLFLLFDSFYGSFPTNRKRVDRRKGFGDFF
jgi:hypothetical protein